MRVLDLFCGAGGAGEGYHRAGFDVYGVDIRPQDNYPFDMEVGDAMVYLTDHEWLSQFDLIHASPPCQHYSVTSSMHENTHPDLYGDVVDAVDKAPVSGWVVENVIGAPYHSGIVLCGSMFGLPVWRHRNFETSFPMMAPGCRHDIVTKPIDVTGTGGPGGRHRKPSSIQQAREALGIDWMTRKELSQAVPPAYTEYIARQLLEWPAQLWRAEVIA